MCSSRSSRFNHVFPFSSTSERNLRMPWCVLPPPYRHRCESCE
ncbi:hypothetical protein HCDG_03392 [Histoplasma capsulatum H143]|uniref:Uncharacterized protein n=1 Tax=Ajellomyces capsulatus (strain H143) TaxID=544712 RepID=C6HBJ3_AJECH|nr:hypothetical protein HCDG_03392 [Histoplasma capsulatum H143]